MSRAPYLLIPLFAALATFAFAQPAAGVEIVVTVSTFKNQSGQLGCRLFSGPKGFPEGPRVAAEVAVPLTGKSGICRFPGVAPGTYAVSVMHDENKNAKLDKNFLGKPVEGYGVSNNHTYAMRAPDWDESKFQVGSGKPVALSIQLRY